MAALQLFFVFILKILKYYCSRLVKATKRKKNNYVLKHNTVIKACVCTDERNQQLSGIFGWEENCEQAEKTAVFVQEPSALATRA